MFPFNHSMYNSNNNTYHKYSIKPKNIGHPISYKNDILIAGFMRAITKNVKKSDKIKNFEHHYQPGNQININKIIFKYLTDANSRSNDNHDHSCEFTRKNIFNLIQENIFSKIKQWCSPNDLEEACVQHSFRMIDTYLL